VTATDVGPAGLVAGVDPFAGIRIIDCDSHLTEPPDLWTARVPASLAERVPVQKTVDGLTSWYLGDESWASIGGNTIRTGHEKVLGSHVSQPFETIDKSAWSAVERLELLDKMGIWGQVLYPNGIGFASNHIFAIEDESLRQLVLQTYNDFLVEVQDESGGRLFPQALLPIWDMELTVAEATRLLDRGITGFTLSDKPEMIGLPQLVEPYFEPMWDLFNESGAVANFHIGAGARREELEALRGRGAPPGGPNGSAVPAAWTTFGTQRRLAVGSSQMFMSNVRILVNLCMSNMFDRYPRLKVVSAESGIGWVPFLLESLDFQFDEMVTSDDELAYAKRRPSEYFRDHMYVMFWFEKIAAMRLIDAIGVNNVLVETDVPHPTCLYPGPREHFETVLAGQSPHVIRRVLQDNAAELYRIKLPATT
jgi:predicted TIM-barrel fold metal-dependent hydrolase